MTDKQHGPSAHPEGRPGRIGIMLVNLGTPDGADVGAVRRYLREFLSDRRVIEAPRLLWWPVLNFVVLTLRPPKTARAYAKIWRRESNESPLRHFTRRQAELLAERFGADDRIAVDWAMRYGTPSIPATIGKLKDAGADRFLVFPLYPQYSATTTASVVDKVAETLAAMRWQPSLRFVPPYYDDPAYIEALAASIEGDRAAQGPVDMLLASFHGLPETYVGKGDPYLCQCERTMELLRERLGLPEAQFRMTFQSRFGPRAWLKPYTAETLAALPGEGRNSVAVVTPGFAADCVETLEEIAIAGRGTFEAAGGKSFRVLPCLNDAPRHIDVLESISRRELGGWLD